jgi:ABC-type Na+ efflux pump permease subunit
MRFSQAWIVASKDFATFRKKRNIIYTVLFVPIIVAILLPGVVYYIEHRGKGAVTPAELVVLLPAFAFFYLILAGMIPTTIASYSIVGEKVEKSLEPLLATPSTDNEILLGKGIAATALPLAAILLSATAFMVATDVVSFNTLGYYYFPNWNAVILLFLMVPLASALSVEWNVVVSSRVSDVRVAQQLGAVIILPFAGLYVGGELNLVQLGDANTLLTIAGAMAIVVLLMLYVVQATFQREEILTNWK